MEHHLPAGFHFPDDPSHMRKAEAQRFLQFIQLRQQSHPADVFQFHHWLNDADELQEPVEVLQDGEDGINEQVPLKRRRKQDIRKGGPPFQANTLNAAGPSGNGAHDNPSCESHSHVEPQEAHRRSVVTTDLAEKDGLVSGSSDKGMGPGQGMSDIVGAEGAIEQHTTQQSQSVISDRASTTDLHPAEDIGQGKCLVSQGAFDALTQSNTVEAKKTRGSKGKRRARSSSHAPNQEPQRQRSEVRINVQRRPSQDPFAEIEAHSEHVANQELHSQYLVPQTQNVQPESSCGRSAKKAANPDQDAPGHKRHNIGKGPSHQ